MQEIGRRREEACWNLGEQRSPALKTPLKIQSSQGGRNMNLGKTVLLNFSSQCIKKEDRPTE